MRVVAIFAHPDDETLLGGGTLAACAAAGAEVGILSLTRGEAGPIARPGLATRETLGEVRAVELQLAAEALGVSTAGCLDFPDGELIGCEAGAVRGALSNYLKTVAPHIVITFGPEGWYWHPDHIAVHDAVVSVLSECTLQIGQPEVYYATWPGGRMAKIMTAAAARGVETDLWGLSAEDFGVEPSLISTTLDVRPFVPAKLRALRAHRTQLGAGHLLAGLPQDLALTYLGEEFFVRARFDRVDLLAELVSQANAHA